MTDSPLVTIGLPVYNSEKYVAKSLESLLSQTYTDFILIINDNASTDSTPDICKRYATQDERVRYYRNEQNIGNPRNFNRILELTETKYLKWSTADDLWDPAFLERAMEVMESDPGVILCYPKTYLIDADGQITREYEDNLHLMQDDPADRFLQLLKDIGLSHQHLGVMRVDDVRKTHLLRPHVASDINLLAEMTLYGKIYELPERLFYRRFHNTSGSWKRGDKKHDAKYYYAGKERRAGFKNWRCHMGFFSAAWTSTIELRSKVRITARLFRRVIWDRHNLVGEIIDYFRGLFERKPSEAFRQ